VILISFWTAPEAQALKVSPTSLSFTGVQGGSTPPSQTVTVSKNNDRTLNWASMDNATRLTSTLRRDYHKGAQIVVSVNTTGLAAGSYAAAITVVLKEHNRGRDSKGGSEGGARPSWGNRSSVSNTPGSDR